MGKYADASKVFAVLVHVNARYNPGAVAARAQAASVMDIPLGFVPIVTHLPLSCLASVAGKSGDSARKTGLCDELD